MKKIISIVIIAAIVFAGVFFVPKLAHTCDSCDEFFIGTGYKPNIVAGFLGNEDDIICKECAEKHHAVALTLGQSLDDFKRDLFE
jgi:hypothetical protein